MLPVVKGDRYAAWAILGHAVVMVGLSLALALLGPGWLYFVCAASGGALLIRRALTLARAPNRANALASFHASLIQLSLLLLGTIADGWMRASLGG
jgi:protoheme IX farnesyltransferase